MPSYGLNVNTYAEQVLFAESLDEKLKLISAESVDFEPLRTAKPLSLPGRPDSLLLRPSEQVERVSLPSRPSLVDDRSRGTLLHFFANHELLAAELMALALLKFPDAPEAFRRGVLQTMQEEQKHTLWYVGRMRECGVALGEFPVSRFFWDMVSTMETPQDYVSRLSLTFEQANLDYSRHFSALMREAGDARTARIMDKIYRDEIEHVGYGLHWFRKWKENPAVSDWDAFRGKLHLPLSPSRAKGNGIDFNREGRLAAGLDEAFVRQLAVFEKSKGRTPNVFAFNPNAEDIIAAGGVGYTASAKVASLVRDLEILQIFLARQDDVILMRKPPSLCHLERLKNAGLVLPEIEPLDSRGHLDSDSTLPNRKVNAFLPWSVAPDLPRTYGPELPASWDQAWAALFSKTEQAQRLGRWMGEGQMVCRDVQQLPAQWGSYVLKQAWAAAGRGVRFCNSLDKAQRVAADWLRQQPSLLVEPLHNRVFDFSVQYQVDTRQIKQLGFVRQKIGSNGRYLGSVSSPKFCKGLDPEVARFLMESALPIFDTDSELCRDIFQWCQSVNYMGPLGIDSYLYRSAEGGELLHRPICEINPRYTMGRIAHEMRRRSVAPGYSVSLQLTQARSLPDSEPIVDSGRLVGGSLQLNEVDSESLFAAVIAVDKNPKNL